METESFLGSLGLSTPSNRTSLEWKLYAVGVDRQRGALLIEPVWNGNRQILGQGRMRKTLLIEPVWNGN